MRLTKNKIRAAKIAELNAVKASLLVIQDQIPAQQIINVELERLERQRTSSLSQIGFSLQKFLRADHEETALKLLKYVFQIKAFKNALSKHDRNTRQKQLEVYVSCLMICFVIPDGITIAQVKKVIQANKLTDDFDFLESLGLIRREKSKGSKQKKIFASKKLICNLTD